MRNKLHIIAMGLSISALSLTMGIIAKESYRLFEPHATDTYSVTFNSNNTNINGNSIIGHNSVNYEIDWVINNGIRNNNELITLSSNGYIETDDITGITSITVICSNDLTISYNGGSDTLSSNNKYNLSSPSNDVRLTASNGSTTITSVQVEYTCSDVSSPFDYELVDNTYVVSLNDTSLTSYDIPLTYNDKPVVMEKGIFSECTNLVSVSVPTLNNQIFPYYFTKGDLPSGYANKGLLVKSSLKNVTVKSGDVIDNAFRNDLYIEGVTLLNTSTIGDNAFYNCTSLEDICLNDGLTSIGKNSFQSCSKLVDIFIPISVSYIGTTLFVSNDSLVSIRCEANEKPANWNNNWYGSYSELVSWGESR